MTHLGHHRPRQFRAPVSSWLRRCASAQQRRGQPTPRCAQPETTRHDGPGAGGRSCACAAVALRIRAEANLTLRSVSRGGAS